ncbi:MAG: HNH endonuclease signature motif containing protein, partial [Mycobacteriales bacterium]
DPPDPDGGPPPPRPQPTQPWPAGYIDDLHAMQARDTGTELPTDPVEQARITRRQWLRRQTPSWNPPRPEPQPPPDPAHQPPTLTDLDWWDQTNPRQAHQADLDRQLPLTPTAPAPTGGWPTPPARPPLWSPQQLHTLLTGLLRKPVDPLPPASSSYPFTGRLARHLKTRDQTCRFPGCHRLAQHCDSDHRIPWPAGPTSISNGISECEHHHQAKHAIFTLTQLPDGTLRWTLPTGHHADAPNRALLRGW